MEGFYKTYLDIIQSIDESLEKQRIIPVLILIYSAIDSFSYVSEKSDKRGRAVFKNWVKTWMLTKYPLPCNEIDIYAARCGLLHQQVSESDLSKENKAKEIFYSWGNSKVELLQFAINKTGETNLPVALKVEDLLFSFRNGIADCKMAIEQDEEWKNIFIKKAKKYFVNLNM